MKKYLLFLILCVWSAAVSAQIPITTPGNMSTCSNFNTGTFNLTTQTAVILGALNPADFTVSYHLTMAAANSGTGAITTAAAFSGSDNQVIYVRVVENANPSNFEVTSFGLVVDTNPSVFDQSFTACDFDSNPADGNTLLDLEEIAEQIYSYSSIMPTDMEITFFASQADAQNAVNGLETPYSSVGPDDIIYARCMFYATGCMKIIAITLLINDCTGECITPDNLTINNNSGTSATFSWTPLGTETQWELLILFSGGPFPLPTMNGLIVNSNPVTVSGIDCPETYDVYIRAVCGTDKSDWSSSIYVALEDCSGGSQPENLELCAQSGSACFDLTSNDDNILDNLNPSDYSITYHTSQSNASAGTSPIANPTSYCTTTEMGSVPIFARLFNNATSAVQVFDFTVTAAEIISGTTSLIPLVQCDDDGNNTVIFDLTTAEAQLNTTDALAYYASYTNATNSVNQIGAPASFSVNVLNPVNAVFIRQTVVGSCDIIHTLPISALANCNVATVCAGANSLCSALGVPFANTTGIDAAESGNNYGCLDETPNPTWFYLPVSSAGTINLMIEQSTSVDISDVDLDSDYVVFGPFTNPAAPCAGQLTADKIVSCSYSEAFYEFPVIANAQPGEFYLLMVTNYFGEPGYIRITETGSSQGEIDCTGLRLTAFLDVNTNGIKDAGEVNFTLGQFHYELNDDSNIHNITAPTGTHKIYEFNPANVYNLSYSIDPVYASNYAITTAAFNNVSVVAGAGLQDYNFPVTITQPYQDLAIAIIPNEQPRPGFTYTNTVLYTNLGNQPVASGTVTFVKAPAVTIASTTPATTATAQGFTYNFTNLLPFETRSITVTMQVPVIPIVELGDVLVNNADITILTGELVFANNGAKSEQIIIGSYDPNDKMESRGEHILFSDFTNNDYLTYTIRFENTGTASAINVRISDVLESSLDASTVRMVSASHDYVLDRIDNNLTWRFENILLPPTIEDPIGSHGYVQFQVKPLPGYAVGDEINNTASIFFDFNPPIVTNTFSSTFVSSLSIDDLDDSNFVLHPNPASTSVTVSLGNDNTISRITIYDMLGKTVLEAKSEGVGPQVVNLSGIQAGIYLFEVITGSNQKKLKKIVIQ